MTTPYALYYWPVLPGRGEIVRLLLEDVGVPYRDVAREEGTTAVVEARKGALGGAMPFAPPILKAGALVLSQSAVIARYLAEKYGLAGQTEADRLLAQQHFLGWADLTDEVHDTHHPIAVSLRYEDQREAAKERAHHFLAGRLAQWLGHFEYVVQDGGGTHVRGSVTYPDLMARCVLRGIEYAFPNALAEQREQIPALTALVEQVEARPNVAAYLASERALPFNQDGIFRHYPELDLDC